MLVKLLSKRRANWHWWQIVSSGSLPFFHLDIQIFRDLQKLFAIFTPIEKIKNLSASCLDFSWSWKTEVFTIVVIRYTSLMERIPNANELVRKMKRFYKMCRNAQMKILSVKVSTFLLITIDIPRINLSLTVRLEPGPSWFLTTDWTKYKLTIWEIPEKLWPRT